MKRSLTHQTNPISPSSAHRELGAAPASPKRAARRARAAMLGIAAISVGATAGVLLPGQGDEAIAAESSLSATSLAAESLETPQVLSVEPDATPEPGVVVESEVVEAIAIPAMGPSLVKHRVEDGDTLWALAQSYGVPSEAIAASNSIDANAVLTVGQTLKIPTAIAARPATSDEPAVAVQPEASAEPAATEAEPASETPVATVAVLPAWQEAAARNPEAARSAPTYSVQSGDTLSAIADRFAVSSLELAQLNEIDDPRRLQPGQRLKLPAEASLPVAAQSGQPTSEDSDLAVASRPALTADPHIAILKDSVMQLRVQYRNERIAAEGSASSPAAEVARRPDTPVLLAPTAVAVPAARVEQPAPAPAPTAERPVEFERPRAIAAAPVPSEAYNRLLQLPSGRTVAPELPPLQGPEQYLPERPQQFNGYIWPARGTLTSGYGPRWGRMHRGIDIAAPAGTPIFAAASGEVIAAGWNNGGYGNLVDIRHPDGSMTRYAHNSRLLVRKGQRVEQGEQIALMGSTGFSTGPHLHFEIHPPGRGAMNPIAFLPRR